MKPVLINTKDFLDLEWLGQKVLDIEESPTEDGCPCEADHSMEMPVVRDLPQMD
jgi:hypothetical protein